MRHEKFDTVGRDITNDIYSNRPIKKSIRPISSIVMHCAATLYNKEYNAYDIDDWHKERWGSGCGYHYVILLDGTIQLGRDVDYQGAHVKHHNSNSIGICYIGGVDENNNAVYNYETHEQRESMMLLIDTLCLQYNLNPDINLFGHNEFPNVHKDCPCLNMDKLRSECLDFFYKF